MRDCSQRATKRKSNFAIVKVTSKSYKHFNFGNSLLRTQEEEERYRHCLQELTKTRRSLQNLSGTVYF